MCSGPHLQKPYFLIQPIWRNMLQIREVRGRGGETKGWVGGNFNPDELEGGAGTRSGFPGEAAPEPDIPNSNVETLMHPATIIPLPQALPGGPVLNSPDERLHIVKWQALFAHHWDYDAKNLYWLPHYTFSKLQVYDDAWTEWALGIHGCLPVHVLYEHFSKPAWHRSIHGGMTEAGRCQKLTSVIEKLANKPQWSIPKALEFLKITYEQQFSTPGTLARLQVCLGKNNDAFNLIMGIQGFWEVLAPAARSQSILNLAIKDGLAPSQNHSGGYRVDIDSYIWLYEARLLGKLKPKLN
ncbi:hypothetical protein BU17DRAFT_70895 [Hysterangium stoloniferum]|nr:hypothetical protein BU17DRAFT_70895 [Hysterangium stoloniferum]